MIEFVLVLHSKKLFEVFTLRRVYIAGIVLIPTLNAGMRLYTSIKVTASGVER